MAKSITKDGVDLSLFDAPVVTDLASLVNGYLLNCRSEGKASGTIENYRRALNAFLWYGKANGFSSNPLKITTVHVRTFLWYLASEPNRYAINNPSSRKPACGSTINKYYRILSAFFGWLKDEGLIDDNPVKHLKTPKYTQKVVQALTPTDIEKLFQTCTGKTTLDIRNKAIISLLLDTGLRISELASINIGDVDQATGAIVVRHGKGDKQRIVHIGSKAQRALWRYTTLYRRGDGDQLFVERNGEPLSAESIKVYFKRLARQTGVKVHPHKLRHTFAISFLRLGGDVFTLRYLLGHSTLNMTQRYLQSLNADDAIREHAKRSPLDNLVTR